MESYRWILFISRFYRLRAGSRWVCTEPDSAPTEPPVGLSDVQKGSTYPDGNQKWCPFLFMSNSKPREAHKASLCFRKPFRGDQSIAPVHFRGLKGWFADLIIWISAFVGGYLRTDPDDYCGHTWTARRTNGQTWYKAVSDVYAILLVVGEGRTWSLRPRSWNPDYLSLWVPLFTIIHSLSDKPPKWKSWGRIRHVYKYI